MLCGSVAGCISSVCLMCKLVPLCRKKAVSAGLGGPQNPDVERLHLHGMCRSHF